MGKFSVLAVVGGDERQLYTAKRFAEKGYEVRRFGILGDESECETVEETLDKANYVLLPVPVTKDGYRLNSEKDILLLDMVKKLPKNCVVFGGKLPPFFKDHLRNDRIRFRDYYEDPVFLWRNADITAEAAASIVMNSSSSAVNGLKILVCGFGRIGKLLTRKFSDLGAKITVASRKKEDLMQARFLFGAETDDIDYGRKGIFDLSRKYDYILNTIPNWIFDNKNSSLLNGTVYIELASPPFGGEQSFMRRKCGEYIIASGLPGKYAPKTAADSVFDCIIGFIEGGESV